MRSNPYCHLMVFMSLLLLFGVRLAVSQRDVKTAGNQTTDQEKPKTLAKAYDLHVPFIANEGQVAREVGFYAKIFGGTFYVITDGEMVYSLVRKGQRQVTAKSLNEKKDPSPQVCVLRERLIQARRITPAGVERSSTKVNYFIGSARTDGGTTFPAITV